MDKLREVDPRLAELAEQSVQRYEAVLKDAGETEMDGYSAYSSECLGMVDLLKIQADLISGCVPLWGMYCLIWDMIDR